MVVQVNGKSYDAVTGRRITDIIAPAHKQVKQAPKPKQITVTKQPSVHSQPAHTTATHAKRHAPQSAQTLMRRAVKKPQSGLKKQLHVQQELAHTREHAIPVKHVAAHVDTARARRAKQIEKAQQVHRFHSPAQIPVTFTHVAVQAAPQSVSLHEPPIQAPPIQSSNPVDIFEQAIANATHFVDIAAHKKHFKKKARRHFVTMTAGIAALLAIASFLTYSNTPSLQARMAGVVAGVSTSMPNFTAAGFKYEGVSAHNERLTYTFRSELATYQLVEQQTNWNGAQMIRQVSSVKANGAPNYTELAAGTVTIYKFSDSHATWVKDGTWYQVHGKQPLTDAQLTALATNS